MIEPALLRGRDVYERRMEGWTDDGGPDVLAHTVRLSDPERALELRIVATISPAYEIREAACRVLQGAIAPSVARGAERLAGTRMVAGFTRQAAEAAGDGEGAAFLVDAAIEAARLSRQVTKVPRERAERAVASAAGCWELDTTSWAELPDSCFTYSAAGRSRLATQAVSTPMQADLYSPRPGQQRVFTRRKLARLERRGSRLLLVHVMEDNVHGFEVTYEVELPSGRIVRAEHVTPRLPYPGICSEPQGKIGALLGEVVDGGLRKRLGAHIGGAGGCAQLYDLTADLLKLLA